MGKKYADFMDEISADDLYKGLLAFGLFSNKIPPVFSSTSFFDYCEKNHPTFSNSDHDYVRYKTLRNINVPRQLGIPVPMAYEKMCSVLKSNWSDIQSHFHTYTDSQTHVISRIHIQKRKNKDELFEMNYDDWRNAGSPKDDLLIGKRFVVKADISTFFPSIYTHSIPWALVGKAVAKQNRSKSKWFNKIDKKCQEVKYGETHGLLIGPHASNLISEMILTVVDRKLYDKGWKFVRNIDDYTCYVETRARADSFIVDLGVALEEFDLQLNNKKTKIEELPDTVLEDWVRKLNGFSLLTSYGKVDYKQARAYFDLAIELMKISGGNASVLNYAIKRQFLLIGYAPKDISLEELPKVFQIRIKGNESLVKWENDLKMASLNKRRTIEYILEQSISTDTPIRYTQAEMDMKIAELTFGSTVREEKSSVALSYVPVVNENPTDNSSNEAITKSTSSMKQDTSKVVSENKDTETASSRTTEENNSDNIFMNSAFAGLE